MDSKNSEKQDKQPFEGAYPAMADDADNGFNDQPRYGEKYDPVADKRDMYVDKHEQLVCLRQSLIASFSLQVQIGQEAGAQETLQVLSVFCDQWRLHLESNGHQFPSPAMSLYWATPGSSVWSQALSLWLTEVPREPSGRVSLSALESFSEL